MAAVLGIALVLVVRIVYRFRWDRTGRQLAKGMRHGASPFDSSIFRRRDIREGVQDVGELDPSAAAALRDYIQRFQESESAGADPFADTRKALRFLNVATYGTIGLLTLGAVALFLGIAMIRA